MIEKKNLSTELDEKLQRLKDERQQEILEKLQRQKNEHQ
jgi:hypothetical protein